MWQAGVMTHSTDSLLNEHDLARLAWDCAQSAGAFLKEQRPKEIEIDTKSSGSDLVSEINFG
jgi:hypothetical protein